MKLHAHACTSWQRPDGAVQLLRAANDNVRGPAEDSLARRWDELILDFDKELPRISSRVDDICARAAATMAAQKARAKERNAARRAARKAAGMGR